MKGWFRKVSNIRDLKNIQKMQTFLIAFDQRIYNPNALSLAINFI